MSMTQTRIRPTQPSWANAAARSSASDRRTATLKRVFSAGRRNQRSPYDTRTTWGSIRRGVCLVRVARGVSERPPWRCRSSRSVPVRRGLLTTRTSHQLASKLALVAGSLILMVAGFVLAAEFGSPASPPLHFDPMPTAPRGGV